MQHRARGGDGFGHVVTDHVHAEQLIGLAVANDFHEAAVVTRG